MDGDENNHEEYRTKTVDYIRENEEEFKWFVQDDEPFNDYCDRM
jgi:hypothetical protein